ncbi:DUF2235 domain-containing protein [Pseudomonas sp. NA-150]|uniref:DUF2235 domain-containing protein n=1 Tax=Pseudomonas sp. NA-150 TaxID=3367525 RepID=UPI0037C71D31
MARQLVVCLDGTGNRFSHCPTNIIRLLRSLSSNPDQVLAYYDQGVGTFGMKETLFDWQKVPSRVLGLAFGWGFQRTIEGAYRFIAENLAAGDELYIFGFSRGAYAARALAALIRAVGVVPAHQAHLFDYAWAMLLAREGPKKAPDFELQARFKTTFGKPVNVRFLGLFDTVKSVGWVYDPLIIPYTASNAIVEVVRHAVAIDERRCFFRTNLWGVNSTVTTDIKEVWFPGVHSDIGGGYAPEEAQLALGAQRWMLGEAMAAGLHVDFDQAKEQLKATQNVVGDAMGPMHDSMTQPWKIAEWVPRLVWNGDDAKREWRIGRMPPIGEPEPRHIEPGIQVHRSVQQRLDGLLTYRPPNLPEHYSVVDDDPSVAQL